MALEHLFDAELQHQPGMAPLDGEGEGILVGSGDGTLAGPALTGTLRWTLFEQPGELVCAMSQRLEIDTSDGAEIHAEGRGFAVRDSASVSEWRVAATFRFRTDDDRYGWVDGALGLWEGDFDAQRHRAHYRAYLQPKRPQEGAPVTTGYSTDALTAARIAPDRRGGERLRELTERERRFYRFILRSFGAGTAPGPDALAGAASELELEVEPTLERFRSLDLAHHDPSTGAILVAYPFSGRPTAHRVRIGENGVYAMCAIDALGIAPMLGEPIQIDSRNPLTGEDVRVELEPGGQGEWQPHETVVLSGTTGRGESRDRCCPVLNFFASSANAERWLVAHPEVQGTPISMNAAIVAGRAVFGDLLEET